MSDRGTASLPYAAKFIFGLAHNGLSRILCWPKEEVPRQEFQLIEEEDPFEPGQYQKVWKESGSGFCRGRISMAPYNGEGRRIDPRHILRPTRGQMMLKLDPEFGASPPSGPHERLLLVFRGEVQPSLPL